MGHPLFFVNSVLKPRKGVKSTVSTPEPPQETDHTTSHRQPWNTWKPCEWKVLKSKWNGTKSTRNKQKLLEKSTPDAWRAGGHRFESCIVHHKNRCFREKTAVFLYFFEVFTGRALTAISFDHSLATERRKYALISDQRGVQIVGAVFGCKNASGCDAFLSLITVYQDYFVDGTVSYVWF